MTKEQRTALPAIAARMAIAGVIIAFGALGAAAPAAADPDAPNPAPGQADGAPPVPQIPNPGYGNPAGPLASLRDLWHNVRNGGMDAPPDDSIAPPASAGPAPKLPPGYVSMNAPGSETPLPSTGPNTGGPPLPPGYYPLNGPPPPGFDSPTP